MSVTRSRLLGARLLVRLFALGLIAAFVVSACTGASRTPRTIIITLPPAVPTIAGATGPVDTNPGATFTSFTISDAASDGKWKVTFKKPIVAGLPDESTSKLNDAIASQVSGYVSAFTARTDFPAVAAGGKPSQLEGDYAVALNSRTVVSLRFTQLVTLSGEEHPTGTPGSLNFDLAAGKAIAFADLFRDPAPALSPLNMSTHSTLFTTLGSELTWKGDATSLDFYAKAWAVTPDGLEFTWPQGEIASAAGGMPSALVPWSDLKAVLKPGTPVAGLVR